MSVSFIVVMIALAMCLWGMGACFLSLIKRDWKYADKYYPIMFWGGLILVFYIVWTGLSEGDFETMQTVNESRSTEAPARG